MKPVCVPCERFYRPKKNGMRFLEGMPVGGNNVPPGKEHAAQWADYKLWFGDKWQCPGCGHEMVIGAQQPIAEHYQTEFKSLVETYAPEFRVNDC